MTKNIFKGPNNKLLLQSLFRDAQGTNDYDLAVYTLKDHEYTDPQGRKYPSLYQLYMACEDPTEWEFATKHLDSWRHWEMLCECTWFQPWLERWRKELELKLRARALKNIMFDAENGGRSAYDANKFLANAMWKPKEAQAPGKRGRPSKEEIQKEAQAQAEQEKRLADDSKRIGLN